jgi:TRAP-type uncharacterized transport system substrate-binding protein
MMKHAVIAVEAFFLLFPLVSLTAPSKAGAPPLDVGVNRGVVELEVEGTTGISARIAEDLARIVNDGATRRILPIIGTGSLQNITDLTLLHGIDVAILQTDVLDYAKQQNLFPGIDSSITYITRLYNEEFHLIARREIKSVADLLHQRVSVDALGSGTAITAGRLFDLLKIAVTISNDDPETALGKLRRGEIAAVALVAGKPVPLFYELIGENGLHFLAMPRDLALPAGYVSARLTAADYPGLVPYNQPIDTVAVGTILAAANLQVGSERYRNVANFVEAFFAGFQSLREPGHHPKWSEVDIMAELPGWRRFRPAEQWLRRNAWIAGTPNPQALKTIFSRFIDERQQATGGHPLSQQDKDQLFGQFELWQRRQLR